MQPATTRTLHDSSLYQSVSKHHWSMSKNTCNISPLLYSTPVPRSSPSKLASLRAANVGSISLPRILRSGPTTLDPPLKLKAPGYGEIDFPESARESDPPPFDCSTSLPPVPRSTFTSETLEQWEAVIEVETLDKLDKWVLFYRFKIRWYSSSRWTYFWSMYMHVVPSFIASLDHLQLFVCEPVALCSMICMLYTWSQLLN